MDRFDPYYKWLGIPPEEQPPDHYRLLGLNRFESDPDVIEAAADRQMAFVQQCASGPNAGDSQRLLNELSAARLCLLNPQRRAKYDRRLEQSAATGAGRQGSAAVAKRSRPAAEGSALPRSHSRPGWLWTFAGILTLVALLTGAGFLLLDKDDGEPLPAKTDTAQRSAAPTGGATPVDIGSEGSAPPLQARSEPKAAAVPEAPKSPAVTIPAEDSAPAVAVPERPPANTPAPPVAAKAPPGIPPEVRAEPELAAEEPAVRETYAVPDEQAQSSAEKTIRGLFSADYEEAVTPDARLKLAKKLHAQAQTTDDDSVARYVLLREARDLAAQAGDIPFAMQVVDAIAADYALEALEEKGALLDRLSKLARTPADVRAVAEAQLMLIPEATLADRYEIAVQLATQATGLATRSRDPALIRQAQSARREVLELRSDHEDARRAIEILKSSPDDPKANQTYGVWLCLREGDWSRGLALLAKGADPRLGALASRDLANPVAVRDMAELAGDWAEWARGSRNRQSAGFLAAAEFWYRQVASQASGLEKLAVEKRIEEIGDLPRKRLARATPTRTVSTDWTVLWDSQAAPEQLERLSAELGLPGATPLELRGPGGDRHTMAEYKATGSFVVEKGVLKPAGPDQAALRLARVADDFELSGTMDAGGAGGWFFFVGTNREHGYLLYSITLRTSSSLTLQETHPGRAATRVERLAAPRWSGPQDFQLTVQDRKLTFRVGEKVLADGVSLPRYSGGDLFLGTARTGYGTANIKIHSLRLRALE